MKGMSKVIGIGFLGLGIVGSQVLSYIKENKDYVEEVYGMEFLTKSVYVRDITKKRDVDTSDIYLTTDVTRIVENPNVQVCIECMGGAGMEETYDAVMGAIHNGKHIVMSSKKCLAVYGTKIIEAANQYNVQLRFEASVGGCIPICRSLMQMSKGDEVTKIYGIVNATSTYILSAMESKKITFDEALQQAKEKGFAENNSSEDILGFDTLNKMRILLRLGMKVDVDCNDVNPVSIENINDESTNREEPIIRQVFYAEKTMQDNINCFVGPQILKSDSMLKNVSENYNMIFVESKHSGLRAYYGKGAGGRETASVMFDDLIDVVQSNYRFEEIKPIGCNCLSGDTFEL